MINPSDVEDELRRIESKYEVILKTEQSSNDVLIHLSQEFDTIGLAPINTECGTDKVLEQVINSTLALIQLHRKTLSQMKDVNLSSTNKSIKNFNLQEEINRILTKLIEAHEDNRKLENKLIQLKNDNCQINKTLASHRDEMNKITLHYRSKLNEATCYIKTLEKRVDHLKELSVNNAGKYYSKDDIFLSTINEHKVKEKKYKEIIQKLQEQNDYITNEIVDLREELILLTAPNN